MIKNNPFTSETFTALWLKHFNETENYYQFSLFDDNIKFYKNKYLPIYTNLGKTQTKGLSYNINSNSKNIDAQNKVFIIYDIPKYTASCSSTNAGNIKLLKSKQYPGYITNLKNYNDFDDYSLKTFSKKSRYKFKSYKRKLEGDYKVSFKHFHGLINKDVYDKLFEVFYKILTKRFDKKSEINNNLETSEWEFYKKVVYPLILEKKASLYVVYANDLPIAFSINYFSDSTLFYAITGFDVDYSKYNVGTIHLMELFKWSFKNNIKIFDFSKGYYDYKERWGDEIYNFENHVLYDSNSISAFIIAHSLTFLFNFKQWLRNKNINKKLSKLSYSLKRKN